MTEAERAAINAQFAVLGVDAPWAATQAVNVGTGSQKANINLQTLLLFALIIADGCRAGLTEPLAREVEVLHKKFDTAVDEQLKEAMS